MKKIFLSAILFIGTSIAVQAQNTIPTTTCTGAMKINDSLNVNKDIMALGDITSKGEMISTDTLRAREDVVASKDIKVDGSIYVGNKLNVEGDINTNTNYYIKNTPVIGILPPIGNPTTDPIIPPAPGTPPIRVFFGPSAAFTPVSTACSDGDYNPWVPVTNNFGGQIQLFDNTGPGMTYNPGGSILNFASWSTASSIDVNGGTQNGGALLMNYFCGKNIAMCTGANGGTVIMGKKVSAAQNVKIGYNGNSNIDANTALEINTSNTGNGVLVTNSSSTVKAYSVLRSDGKNSFVVYGDGKMQLGADKVVSGPHTDAMLSVGGNGKIACKEVRVFSNASGNWADFVFDKSYKLMPLLEVERYYKNNKHLPNIPTAKQIEENGNDLAKTDALLLQKIEELTLYIVQQQKEIDKLNKKLNGKK